MVHSQHLENLREVNCKFWARLDYIVASNILSNQLMTLYLDPPTSTFQVLKLQECVIILTQLHLF